MTAIKSQHSRTLEHLIIVRRQELLEAMASGVPNDSYLIIVGKVHGLDEALKFSEEADFKLSGEES